jgi:cytidylate kinase
MPQSMPVVITISRQLGSGAALIGQHLAQRLGMHYLDREILQRAAQQLHMSEDVMHAQDETITPFWQSLMQPFAYGSPEALYMPPPLHLTTDHELYQVESAIIAQVARTQSAVIVGRGGVHVLQNHPRHFSIFLHARQAFRQHRVEELYHLSAKEARGVIEASDHNRTRYHRLLAGKDGNDARQYHLCLDTSVLGVTAAVEVILSSVHACFAGL